MSRLKLLHTSEQLAAVLGDFAPELAPTLARHRDALIEEGFTRAEAVHLAAELQHTVVAMLMSAARLAREDLDDLLE